MNLIYYLKEVALFIRVRLPGGYVWESMRSAIKIFKYDKSKFSLFNIAYQFIIFAFGTKPTSHIRRYIIYSADKCYALPHKFFLRGQALYHWTPAENVDQILREGLQSSRGKVFLTDNPKYIIMQGFKAWKKDIGLCRSDLILLCVDTGKFDNDIYYNQFLPHEYYTDFVPPECIHVVEDKKSLS